MPPKATRPARGAARGGVAPQTRAFSPLSPFSPAPLAGLQHRSPLPSAALVDSPLPPAPQDKADARLADSIAGSSGSLSLSDGVVALLRARRDAAERRGAGDAAAWWGDKVLTMTYDPSDALPLARAYLATSQPTRAERLLSHPALLSSTPAHSLLAAQSAIKLEKWSDALAYLEAGDGLEMPNEEKAGRQYLRGLVLGKQGDSEGCKKALLGALKTDPGCFEALAELGRLSLLSTDENSALLRSLDFGKLGELSTVVRLLYESMLGSRKAIDVLEKDWRLAYNPDLNFERARGYWEERKIDECVEVTGRILDYDPHNLTVLPLHIACLHALRRKHQLFYLAHELVARYPDRAVTWFAVGTYYLLAQQTEESRRYFGKATSIDHAFGPAWIGFAHAFAEEGEHDAAVAAYSTAARLFNGMYQPLLWLGVEHGMLGNLGVAEGYLSAACEGGKRDPGVWNEVGVGYYRAQKYAKAVEAFTKALELANEEADRPSKSGVWEATHLNLGLAYYHLGSTALSKTHLEKVLSLNPKSATALGALGMVAHAQGEVVEAVGWYHRSLAIETDEVIAEMLNFALEELPDADSGTIAAGAEVGEGAWVPDKLRVLVTEGPLSERASPLHPAHVPAQHIPIGSLSGVIPTRKGKEALGGAVDAVTPVPDPGRLAPPAHNHRARRRIDSFESVEDDEAEDLGAYDANNEEVYGDDEDDEGGFEEDMEME